MLDVHDMSSLNYLSRGIACEQSIQVIPCIVDSDVINLDLAPEDRYTPLIKKQKTYLKEILFAGKFIYFRRSASIA